MNIRNRCSSMTASKFKQPHQIHSRYSIPRRRIYDDNKTSVTKLPKRNIYREEEEDDNEEEEGDSPYADYSADYSDPESAASTPRNEFYSPEESESIPESTPVEVASANSVSNFRGILESDTPTPIPYVNIAPLPIFRGTPEECPITHLSRFLKVCRANNATSVEMMMRIFPVTLDNEAALWYDLEIEPYPSLTWEETKSAFLNVYRMPEFMDKYRSEIMMLKQGENESVNAFFLRMQWILRRWPDHGIPDDVLKGIFMDGLREDFQDWIDPQKPNSLLDALKLALAWEQAKSIRAARNKKGVLKCGFCDGPHVEAVCEIKVKMKELWFKIKEKKMRATATPSTVLEKDDGVEKCYGRSSSVATSSNIGQQVEGEGKEDGGQLLDSKKRSQCQCWKHQCWKKKLERNNSIITRNYKGE